MNKLIQFFFMVIVLIAFNSNNSHAQILNKLEQKVTQKANQKVDKKVDSELDKAEEKATNKYDSDTRVNEAKEETQSKPETVGTTDNTATQQVATDPYVSSYTSKFDFVPGEKVLIYDDFAQDAVGDFPALWFTDGSGEIVTMEGPEGKWLMLQGRAQYFIDQLLTLPDNFTVQFDLKCSVPFSWSSGIINMEIKDVTDIDRYRKGQNGGESSSNNINYSFRFDLHPGRDNPGNSPTLGYGHYRMSNQHGNIELKEMFMPNAEKNQLKVSIWRQNQRLRIYLNENKILDLPKILPAEMKPSMIVWRTEGLEGEDHYFISNIRVAVGNPDTRTKLLTEGKLVTTGILFNVNSDKIKPESYGVLKEIASILKENESLNVKIVGHTDSDGDAAANLELSKRRAESVKNALNKDFGIAADRMTTDGKGEGEPLFPNTAALSKANNRRVEFIKEN